VNEQMATWCHCHSNVEIEIRMVDPCSLLHSLLVNEDMRLEMVIEIEIKSQIQKLDVFFQIKPSQ